METTEKERGRQERRERRRQIVQHMRAQTRGAFAQWKAAIDTDSDVIAALLLGALALVPVTVIGILIAMFR